MIESCMYQVRPDCLSMRVIHLRFAIKEVLCCKSDETGFAVSLDFC